MIVACNRLTVVGSILIFILRKYTFKYVLEYLTIIWTLLLECLYFYNTETGVDDYLLYWSLGYILPAE